MKPLRRGLLILPAIVGCLLVTRDSAWASQPTSVQMTSVTQSAFTVVWYTRFIESGSLLYGTSCATATTPSTGADLGNGYSHAITVGGLNNGTTYYVKVVSGGATYANGGACYSVATFPYLDQLPPSPESIWGFVTTGCSPSTAVNGAVVTVSMSRSGVTSSSWSAVTNANGYYVAVISNTRTSDGSAYFNPQSGDVMTITYDDGNIDTQTITVTYTGVLRQQIASQCLHSRLTYLGNPGFEYSDNGTGLWTENAIATRETTVVHSGSYALQASATAPNQSTTESMAVAPNQSYDVSAWVNQSVASGAALNVKDTDTGNYFLYNTVTTAQTGAWVQLKATFTTGATTRAVTVELNNTAAGTYYWDDALIRQTSLVNGGFEMSPHGQTGWSWGAQAGDTAAIIQGSRARSGAVCGEMITAGSSDATYLYENIDGQPGHTYTLTAYVDQTAPGAQVNIWENGQSPLLGSASANSSILNTYQQLSVTFTVPTGASFYQVVLRANGPGTFYWDDVSVSG